jgi:hypothetical protein
MKPIDWIVTGLILALGAWYIAKLMIEDIGILRGM